MTPEPKYVFLVWSGPAKHLVAVCETSAAADKLLDEMRGSYPDESFYTEARGLVQ